ncbi:MAG TPA: hypothetical protein VMR89_09830 [Actinomycetota bacterium]|nr:hypothetical protein [Actinomycetota bacterium]
MRKKLGFVVGAMALTFVLSSCWALQSFVIVDYTLTPGQATKAKFTLRPMGSDYASVFTGARQFVIIGVGTLASGQNTDIGVSKARWGVNGQFGGPIPMGVENNLVTALGTDCSSSGLNFADITGVLWKAFATPVNKNDGGKVEKKSVIDVVLKAKAAAVDPGENYTIMGVAGAWQDDGDGNPEASGSSDDSYACWGIATASVHVKA